MIVIVLLFVHYFVIFYLFFSNLFFSKFILLIRIIVNHHVNKIEDLRCLYFYMMSIIKDIYKLRQEATSDDIVRVRVIATTTSTRY
jgi:hypothetical protein